MPKYSFTLQNIIPYQIDKKYSILNFTTKIVELDSTPKPKTYTFIDETMKSHNCVVSMLDYLNKPLPTTTSINCFWCRHSFPNIPIGCPIEYISSVLCKHYYSELHKDNYSIKGNVTNRIASFISQLQENSQFIIDKKDYYLTDGIFCSFNCCLAFINENKSNQLYKKSEYLLYKLFNKLFNNLEINPASSWRLLKNYGGFLSIEEYRNNFNKIIHIDLKDFIQELPVCKPIGFLFEKKIKF
jgi:hypothetical protein